MELLGRQDARNKFRYRMHQVRLASLLVALEARNMLAKFEENSTVHFKEASRPPTDHRCVAFWPEDMQEINEEASDTQVSRHLKKILTRAVANHPKEDEP